MKRELCTLLLLLPNYYYYFVHKLQTVGLLPAASATLAHAHHLHNTTQQTKNRIQLRPSKTCWKLIPMIKRKIGIKFLRQHTFITLYDVRDVGLITRLRNFDLMQPMFTMTDPTILDMFMGKTICSSNRNIKQGNFLAYAMRTKQYKPWPKMRIKNILQLWHSTILTMLTIVTTF